MIKTVGVDKKISIEDSVRFVIETKDGSGCPSTPYRVDSIKIFFVTREFTDSTASTYELVREDESLVKRHEDAVRFVCVRKKDPVVVATTENLNLSGLQTVDGVSVSESDRVLVKDQSDPVENGIYNASSGDWSRASDSTTLAPGSYVFVEEGVQNAAGGWYLVTVGSVSVGSTPLSFVKFSHDGNPSSPDAVSESVVNELAAMRSESASSSEFYYKDAEVVKVIGGNTDPRTGEFYPAWLNPEMVPSELRDKTIGDNLLAQVYEGDEAVPGKFEILWDPSGLREGDYFVCWTWRPNLSGESRSAHMYFSLGGGVGLTAAIPTHRTDPRKYEMLLERYTPDMFKSRISEGDLSPMVMKGLNESVGAGFTMIENLANQIIDLLDSNATHEQLLPLLSNMFALRIKSSDPTLWRRQIKKAVPNFKKKGTISGLSGAFGDAGMKLVKLTRLWQVVSEYTFQEHFDYEDSKTFLFSKKFVDLIGLFYRPADGSWQEVTSDAASLALFEEDSITWMGSISSGDSVRVLYATREIPAGRQSLEDYIVGLPLMDMRDERGQEYPPKNWNTRVIEEDDPMLPVLVPVRHPIADPVVWGWVRTEFPYSENAYNMDEYNGSKRQSINPCDIDKDFLDPCGSCQSSMFNMDLEVEGLSDASFGEALQVVEEFMPFHSVVHTFNLNGSRTEFFGPAEERIETLVRVSGGETILAGEAQHIFNRDVDSRDIDAVRRDLLASLETVNSPSSSTSWHGTIRNSRVCLYPCALNSESELNDPDFRGLTQGFGAYNINTSELDPDPFESGNLLEVLGASTRNYTLVNVDGSSAEIYGEVDSSVVGPLFEYRVSNKLADLTVDVTQVSRIVFSDEDADFHLTGVVTQKDIDDGVSEGEAWTLRHLDKEYKVMDIFPDDTLLLEELGDIDPVSGWVLMKGGLIVKSSDGGSKSVTALGLVAVSSPSGFEARSRLKAGDYVCMDWGSSPLFYRIRSFKAGEDRFYIEGYEGGDLGGEQVKVYRRVIERKIGQVGYDGLVLDADDDLEALLPVSNGTGFSPDSVSSSYVMQNYLLFIGSEYYTILGVDGSSLTLGGRLDSYTKSGQGVDFTVYRFSKENLSIRERFHPPVPGFEFDSVGRSGKALISVSQGSGDASMLSAALNASGSRQPLDFAGQQESIDFEVEYRDGEER